METRRKAQLLESQIDEVRDLEAVSFAVSPAVPSWKAPLRVQTYDKQYINMNFEPEGRAPRCDGWGDTSTALETPFWERAVRGLGPGMPSRCSFSAFAGFFCALDRLVSTNLASSESMPFSCAGKLCQNGPFH